MRAKLLALLLLSVCSLAAAADEPPDRWQVRGLVLDEHGKPTDDFDAANWWSSNGIQWDEKGEDLPAKTEADREKNFWREEGVLAVRPTFLAKHEPGGMFTLDVEDRPRVSVFVANKDRTLGGLVSVEKTDAAQPIEIRLRPLTRVHGRVYCSEAGRTPEWTNSIVHPVGDRENYLHFIHCGSLRGEFAYLLPPGAYDFDIYTSEPTGRLPKPKSLKNDAADTPYVRGLRVDVPAQKVFDLGTVEVVLPRDKDGIPRDITLYYGKNPPDLQFTDARGVKRDFKLADLRGKWVLLDFWTLHCGPCIYRSLPELTKIYEEHAADRDKFEILAICDTEYEKAPTLDLYDPLAAKIADEVWKGKSLPFPQIIDGEGRTTARYGVQSWPTTLLIDPDGNLVKGDETTLVKKLNGE
jgi:thiol-disulfide isomerase/thioredoxin